MSLSPNSSLVRFTIDLNYAKKQRSTSIKWFFINAALFLLLTYDLVVWSACGARRSALAWLEAGAWCGACCAAASHALRLLPRRPPAPRALSAPQRALLGLRHAPDSSFEVVPEEQQQQQQPVARGEAPEPGSLSPPRAWRGAGARGAGGASPPPSPPSPRAPRDEFIADQGDLHRYLSRVSADSPEGASEWVQQAGGAGGGGAHQLSPGAGGGAGGEQAAPEPARLWRRLRVEPRQLAQLELNLRRWLHATVLERVARELDAADAALAGAGLPARLGAAPPARLQALAAGAGAGARRLRRLLPFLAPWPDQRYTVARVRALAAGGCLAAYRWDAGGADWERGRHPADAELVLHLLAAYLEAVVPGGGFRAQHVSAAPAPPPPLAVHRVAAPQPHYVLALEGELLELPAGRHNLLHTLLLFLAAAARRDPPDLCRLHLGPAGLNMLWILGR